MNRRNEHNHQHLEVPGESATQRPRSHSHIHHTDGTVSVIGDDVQHSYTLTPSLLGLTPLYYSKNPVNPIADYTPQTRPRSSDSPVHKHTPGDPPEDCPLGVSSALLHQFEAESGSALEESYSSPRTRTRRTRTHSALDTPLSASPVSVLPSPGSCVHRVSAFSFTPSSTAESDAESDPEGETDDDASSGPCLVHARAAPAWIISPHILHGYRVRHTSADALRSLFRLHNETCSVWSHLLGLFFFAALGLWRWPQLEHAPAYLRLCFAGFYVCVCVCMGCSAGYHLFNCVDLDVYRWAYAIDMTGIVFCILAQYAGALTLAFACFPTLQIVYLVVCFTLASVALISQHHSSCRFPMPMWRRVVPLITFAGSVVVPFAHWGLITTQFQLTMLALPMLAAFCLYCIGLAFWLTAMPERLIPGVLDRFLTSHGLWHICVVAAAATFERGLFATVELVVNGSWCQGIS